MEISGVINGHDLKVSGFALNEVAIFRQSTVFLWKPIWPKGTQNALWRLHGLSTTLLKLYGAINGHY